MPRIKSRYFRLYSDGKRIKELTWEEWKEIAIRQLNWKERAFSLCKICDTEIYLRKGEHSFWISRKQMEKVLNEAKY